jgi:hypothetical protein
MDFLGKVPLNLAKLSPYTGKKIATTAKALDYSLSELYDEFSVADNYQLTGSSYVHAHPEKHRLLGDLSTQQKKPFIQNLLDLAEEDILERFIDKDSQARTKQWFQKERQLLNQLWDHSNELSNFYQRWIQAHDPKAQLKLTSHLFQEKKMAKLNFGLLKKIIKNYDLFREIYNQSIEESGVELSPLNHGTLPFFATYREKGKLVRSEIKLAGEKLTIADFSFSKALTFEELFEKVDLLVGKALLLILTVRDFEIGHPLVLPELGSLYTPAAHILAKKMQQHHFIDHPPHPIIRLQFNFIDHLKNSSSTLSLPSHLHQTIGKTLPAKELVEELTKAIREAKHTLEQLKNPEQRAQFFSLWTAKLSQEIDQLKKEKESCGRDPLQRAKCPAIWKEIKIKEQKKERICFRRIVDLVQTTEMTYWNSRGALKPWSIAAGGESFYKQLLQNSILREE